MKTTNLTGLSRRDFLIRSSASALALAASGSLIGHAFATTETTPMKTTAIPPVSLKSVQADGVKIFYRESLHYSMSRKFQMSQPS